MSLAAEAKKAKLMRQYAGSRIDLNLDDDAKTDFLSAGKSGRRQSMRKGSVFVGIGTSKHRQEIIVFSRESDSTITHVCQSISLSLSQQNLSTA